MKASYLIGVLFFFGGAVYAAPEAPKVPIVFVDTAAKTKVSDELTYPARILPEVEATVLAEGDGVVGRILTPLGKRVRRGSTILTIRNTDPIYQYAPLKAVTPVAGVVSSVEVTEGTWVNKGQRLATIVDPTHTKISIEVSGEDLSSISAGLVGELILPGEEKSRPVRVLGLSPFVDPATGTATCELTPVSKGEPISIRAGFIGKVTFRVREHEGFQIPEMAVVYRGDKTFLRLVEKEQAKLVPVALGEMRRGLVEIKNGLPAGATYVVRSSTFVADGEKVQVQKAGTGTP